MEVPENTRRRLGAAPPPACAPRGKSCGAVRTVDSQEGGTSTGRCARPLPLAPLLLSASAALTPLPLCARGCGEQSGAGGHIRSGMRGSRHARDAEA